MFEKFNLDAHLEEPLSPRIHNMIVSPLYDLLNPLTCKFTYLPKDMFVRIYLRHHLTKKAEKHVYKAMCDWLNEDANRLQYAGDGHGHVELD